jgi:hypothetical protein
VLVRGELGADSDCLGEQHHGAREGAAGEGGAGDERVAAELAADFGDATTLDDCIRALGLPSGGAVRASLGLASNFADVDRFASFAREFVDLQGVPDDLPPRTGC